MSSVNETQTRQMLKKVIKYGGSFTLCGKLLALESSLGLEVVDLGCVKLFLWGEPFCRTCSLDTITRARESHSVLTLEPISQDKTNSNLLSNSQITVTDSTQNMQKSGAI